MRAGRLDVSYESPKYNSQNSIARSATHPQAVFSAGNHRTVNRHPLAKCNASDRTSRQDITPHRLFAKSVVVPAQAGIQTHIRRSGEGRSPDSHSSLRRRPESRLTLVAPANAGAQTHTRRSGVGRSPDSHSSLRRRPESRLTLVAPAKVGAQAYARMARHALVPFPRTEANARTHASTPWRQATFLVLCEARLRATSRGRNRWPRSYWFLDSGSAAGPGTPLRSRCEPTVMKSMR